MKKKTFSRNWLHVNQSINTLKLTLEYWHYRHYFQMHFLEWKWLHLIQISLKFVPHSMIDNMSPLVQVMAWCQIGNSSWGVPYGISAAYMRQSIGSALVSRQAIIWTSAVLLSTGQMPNFSFTKMHLNISSAIWQPFGPGGDIASSSVKSCGIHMKAISQIKSVWKLHICHYSQIS